MKGISPSQEWSFRIEGLVAEGAKRQGKSRPAFSEFLGLGKETLTRKSGSDDLGTLDFLTVAQIAHAAGFDIKFERRDR